jgi:hypothetical protein
LGNASRPVIHVKPKNADQRPMWLFFSDAMVRYGLGLIEIDLGEAYRKAGVSFREQLEQNFVVIHDRAAYPDKAERPKPWRTTQLTNEVNLGSPRKGQKDKIENEPEPKIPKNELNYQAGKHSQDLPLIVQI